MSKQPIIENNSFSGFEFLPVEISDNSIIIYSPFSKLTYKSFSNRGLNISFLETGSIEISFEGISSFERKVLLIELKEFIKKARREVIEKFTMNNKLGISYL